MFCDFFFVWDGIVVDIIFNVEMVVFVDLRLEILMMVCNNGIVKNFMDWRYDFYNINWCGK